MNMNYFRQNNIPLFSKFTLLTNHFDLFFFVKFKIQFLFF